MAEEKRERRNWTMAWNVAMCREILIIRPYMHNPKSTESSTAWTKICTNLGNCDGFAFGVKAIRDHFTILLKKRTVEVNAEKKLSGVNIELTELQVLLDEIQDDIEKEKEVQAARGDSKREKELIEKEKAEEVRKKAMETYGETSKRRKKEGKDDADVSSPSPKRRSGGATLELIMERSRESSREAAKQHEEELKLRREELALQREQMMMQQRRQEDTMNIMSQHMMQQSQLLTALVEKMSKN